MGLILTSYVPVVQCQIKGPQPSRASCTFLTQLMTSSVTPRTFGLPADAKADVKLPAYFHEPSRKCVAAIFTTGITDTSTYYEMWEAVVAVTGMCVRAGYSGTAFLRGRNRQLFVEVTSERRDLDQV
ncbi:MAG: hypothetical protein LQ349_003120 [Xanthoria aureola]|nr:MAG: hypothetical protein LQ349_003120 [Xanthoria aureola]